MRSHTKIGKKTPFFFFISFYRKANISTLLRYNIFFHYDLSLFPIELEASRDGFGIFEPISLQKSHKMQFASLAFVRGHLLLNFQGLNAD